MIQSLLLNAIRLSHYRKHATRFGKVVVVVVVRRTGPVQVLLTTAVYLPIKLTVHFVLAHGGAKVGQSQNPIPEIQKIQDTRHGMLITVKHG